MGLPNPLKKTWGPFTQADIDRVQQIALGNITPSQSDYDKYDINGSGHLSALDMLQMQRMMLGYTPYTVEYTITLNTQNMREMIVLSSTLGQTSKIGTFGVDAPDGRFNDVVIKSHDVGGGYRLSVDENGFVRAEQEKWIRKMINENYKNSVSCNISSFNSLNNTIHLTT